MLTQHLILDKNRAFEALERADLAIARREHARQAGRAEPVPWAWHERRAALAEAYEQAKRAVRGWDEENHGRWGNDN